jgi:MFS family permease
VTAARRTLAVTFVTLGIVYGVWYSYSVFLVALLREFGWSRSLVAGAFSLFALGHGLISAPLGALADRVGARRLIAIGGGLLAGALVLDGSVRAPWQLYLAFGVLTSLGVSAAGWVPAVVLVQRLFSRRVGTAIGIASAGIGAGIFLMVPLCEVLIQVAGWRWAFRAYGLLVALWVIPASLWLLRDPPRAPPVLPEASPLAGGPTLARALRAPRFWIIFAAQVLGSGATQLLFVHQVAYLVDQRVNALVAASVVSVVSLASVVGKIGSGWLSDRIGREPTYTIGVTSFVGAVVMLGVVSVAPGPLPAYLYGILVGLGYSVNAALIPAVVSDIFRGRHFGAIFGVLHLANAVGGSIGPWTAGRVFDVTGSYRLALVMAAVAAVLGIGGLWIAGPRRGALR